MADSPDISYRVAKDVVTAHFKAATTREISLYRRPPRFFPTESVGNTLIVFGYADWAVALAPVVAQELYIMLPSGPPPHLSSNVDTILLLPHGSRYGEYDAAWQEWAEARRVPVHFTSDISTQALIAALNGMREHLGNLEYLRPMLFLAAEIEESQRAVRTALEQTFGRERVKVEQFSLGGGFSFYIQLPEQGYPQLSVLVPETLVAKGRGVAGCQLFSSHNPSRIVNVDRLSESRFLSALFPGDVVRPVIVTMDGRARPAYIKWFEGKR